MMSGGCRYLVLSSSGLGLIPCFSVHLNIKAWDLEPDSTGSVGQALGGGYLEVTTGDEAGIVEVQREHHGEAGRGVAVRGADAAKRPQDGEHRLHALHCTHTHTHTHTHTI